MKTLSLLVTIFKTYANFCHNACVWIYMWQFQVFIWYSIAFPDTLLLTITTMEDFWPICCKHSQWCLLPSHGFVTEMIIKTAVMSETAFDYTSFLWGSCFLLKYKQDITEILIQIFFFNTDSVLIYPLWNNHDLWLYLSTLLVCLSINLLLVLQILILKSLFCIHVWEKTQAVLFVQDNHWFRGAKIK